MADTTYEFEMEQGRATLAARDFSAAYQHFGRAHGIGHDVLSQHLAAHRGLLVTAWRQRRPDRILTQIVFLSAAALFDRSQQK
ncbi:DUF3703 domain-containing protein [Nocardia sp. NPDC051570]|uniref:DUF3703 domain-containing protein n=1 Tax=Nocardia sp. NPDC051570 TaxID=3364324 RepID=UPI0037920CFE